MLLLVPTHGTNLDQIRTVQEKLAEVLDERDEGDEEKKVGIEASVLGLSDDGGDRGQSFLTRKSVQRKKRGKDYFDAPLNKDPTVSMRALWLFPLGDSVGMSMSKGGIHQREED